MKEEVFVVVDNVRLENLHLYTCPVCVSFRDAKDSLQLSGVHSVIVDCIDPCCEKFVGFSLSTHILLNPDLLRCVVLESFTRAAGY